MSMYDNIFARHYDPLYASVDDVARITAEQNYMEDDENGEED